MLTIKLKLLYLHLALLTNKLIKHFIALLLFGLRIKNKGFIFLLLLYVLFQSVLNYRNGENFIKVNYETLESLNIPNNDKPYIILIVDQNNEIAYQVFLHHIIYCVLTGVIICMLIYIFRDNFKDPKFVKFPRKLNISIINQLIIRGKIEEALKKIYNYAKQRDEDLKDEISSLLSEFVRSNNE